MSNTVEYIKNNICNRYGDGGCYFNGNGYCVNNDDKGCPTRDLICELAYLNDDKLEIEETIEDITEKITESYKQWGWGE